jgi:hypothetical protein
MGPSARRVTLLYGCYPERGQCSLASVFKGKVKVKVKLSLYLVNYALRHENVWRSGCINPYFLDLGISWR